MAEDNFEKTEEPTPRKRQEARDEGQVARSMDLTAACALAAAVLMLFAMGGRVVEAVMIATRAMLESAHAGNPARLNDLVSLVDFSVQMIVRSLLPMLAAVVVVVLAANICQVGFLITLKPITPRFSKLSPARGIKNLVNARAAMRFVMSLGKIVLILGLASLLIYLDLPRIMHLGQLSPSQALTASSQIAFEIAIKLVILLLILAILDYLFQRWQHERDLRMSKQEVKDEMKRMEGDPLIKQRRSQVARQVAMQRAAQQVPNADVVVTNPTHYAVALRYDGQTMHAPKVIGKGADYLAWRIRQIAISHGIPLVERKPLAQALYHNVEVGQEVPPEHYAAVAEILAYVYRLSQQKRSA